MVGWKRLAVLSVGVALLAGGGWVWLQDASAAIGVPSPGTVVVCGGDRDHWISVNTGPFVEASTQAPSRLRWGRLP